MNKSLSLLFLILFPFYNCIGKHPTTNANYYRKATQTIDSIYKYYSVEGSFLLRETFPFESSHTATYLAEEPVPATNQYSYLWPYSGIFSAINAIYAVHKDDSFKQILNDKVLPGLEEYFDSQRKPFAYSSYIATAPFSDRFYDDNIWLGIDFANLYLMTKEDKYLQKSELIWRFIESGTDSILGDGIYWCEQKKESKNTCSNAPGAVIALKLYEATKQNHYLERGKQLYNWTQQHLQDPEDGLYYDNIGLGGRIGKAKYPYNSGQMLQAASLLYKLTHEQQYLVEAQKLAAACSNYFFIEETNGHRMLRNENNWFIAVMLRGFEELYLIDNNPRYISDFKKSMDYAWTKSRKGNGLFEDNQFNEPSKKKKTKWLLTQAAMVEMYARLSNIDIK